MISRRALLFRWLLAETIVVTIGLALCAVQLLPTMEAAGESSRAKGMGQSWSLDGAKAAATTLIGPIPDRNIEPIHWETRGCIGFTWAVMAIVGARLGGRRALVPTLIALGMLAYALGGSYFVDRLPGFNNFRMPTRMLLTLAFPVAFLAGLGVQSLGHERAKSILRVASAFWAIVLLNFVTVEFLFQTRKLPISNSWLTYVLLVGMPWTVLLAKVRWRPSHLAGAVAALLIADLLVVDVQYPDTRPIDEIYPRSPIIDYIRENNSDGQRVYDLGLFVGRPCVLGQGSPQASVHGIPSMLGYNPLDVARYREFLAFMADISEQQQAFSGRFTHPVVSCFNAKNRALIDLLGVQYVICDSEFLGDDPSLALRAVETNPSGYDFLGGGNGPFSGSESLRENRQCVPRTFIVAHAANQAPESEVLMQFKSINFRNTATLDNWDVTRNALPTSANSPGPAQIRSHKPNEIVIDLDGKTAGLLVLTDPWYPGWVCRVDGQEVPIWKADYAFRGVMVPEGSREVVFHFEPQSYRRGKWISIATLLGIVAFPGVLASRRIIARR